MKSGFGRCGLSILCRACSGPSSPDLVRRYEAEIIGGLGAFVVAAEDFGQFAESVRKKLILEIAGVTPDAPGPWLEVLVQAD